MKYRFNMEEVRSSGFAKQFPEFVVYLEAIERNMGKIHSLQMDVSRDVEEIPTRDGLCPQRRAGRYGTMTLKIDIDYGEPKEGTCCPVAEIIGRW